MHDITPSAEQAQAIASIVTWYRNKKGPKEFYLAGYAGVGKSTVANLAIEELKDKCRVRAVRTAAFTGKAASVLRRKGVSDAQTIHSLIYMRQEDEETGEVTWAISPESDAATADLIVLDECSMVDDQMANDLRSFKKKILVMGDPGQLPPVRGAGAFTAREPDMFLREIHRQAAESPIIHLATLARQGLKLPHNFDRDGVKVLKLDRDTQPMVYDPATQPICGLNRVRYVYNRRIRERRGFGGTEPQGGERIICTQNNKLEGLFNGLMGVVDGVIPAQAAGHPVLEMYFTIEDIGKKEGLLVDPYLFNAHFHPDGSNHKPERLKLPRGMPRLNEFDFGYIITCHKAQGSSWDHVTVVDDSGSFREHRANWLYTAITRAETGLTLLTR